jgi:hypothetical protein
VTVGETATRGATVLLRKCEAADQVSPQPNEVYVA